jgi:CheY-like chemotaxis protein
MREARIPCSVLVVEDEPLVRMVAVEMLQDAGLEELGSIGCFPAERLRATNCQSVFGNAM